MTISFSYPLPSQNYIVFTKFYLNYEILFYSFDSIQKCLFLTNTNTKANIFIKGVPKVQNNIFSIAFELQKEYQIDFIQKCHI